MKTINYEFRERLNQTIGGFSHNYCYQCGACVADCPAHRFLPEFNPRVIIRQALFGFEEELTGPNAIIWNCTNCYNCYERCPQEVQPIEVIIALKNISRAEGTGPEVIDKLMDRVADTGTTAIFTKLIEKRRRELGLPELKTNCVDDLKKILKG